MLTLKAKIPITIYPLFIFMMLLIGWINSLSLFGMIVWSIVIFFSVIVHEYGHALTAVGFGQRAQIDLVGLGGLTTREGPRLKLWQEFLIVLNGPLAGFLLWGLSLQLLKYVKDPHTLWGEILVVSSQVNLFWTIVNLLPIHPLDGGHLLNILMEALFGFRGIKIALFISFVLAALFSILCFMVQLIVPGALFLLMAFEGYRAWKMSLKMTSVDRDDTQQTLLKEAYNNISRGSMDEALTQLKILRSSSRGGLVYIQATQEMAKLLMKQGNELEAFECLLSIRNDLDMESKWMLFQLASRRHAWDLVREMGKGVYRDFPRADTAVANAMAHAHFKEVTPAVGWLERAVLDGATNVGTITSFPEFDPIREDPLFQRFCEKLKKDK